MGFALWPSGRQHLDRGLRAHKRVRVRLISLFAAPQPLPAGVRLGHSWWAPYPLAQNYRTFHANIIHERPAREGVVVPVRGWPWRASPYASIVYGKGGGYYVQVLPTPY